MGRHSQSRTAAAAPEAPPPGAPLTCRGSGACPSPFAHSRTAHLSPRTNFRRRAEESGGVGGVSGRREETWGRLTEEEFSLCGRAYLQGFRVCGRQTAAPVCSHDGVRNSAAIKASLVFSHPEGTKARKRPRRRAEAPFMTAAGDKGGVINPDQCQRTPGRCQDTSRDANWRRSMKGSGRLQQPSGDVCGAQLAAQR